MFYSTISNRASSRFTILISVIFSLILLGGLKTSRATIGIGDTKLIKSLIGEQKVLKLSKVYNKSSITPSMKKVIIEIQDTGPELPYIYMKAGFEDEWIKSIDEDKYKKKIIEHIKIRETLHYANLLLAKCDLKRVLEEKFPNATVIVPFVPLIDFIEQARSWPKKVKPVNLPSVSKPRLQYSDIIVHLDFRQATSMQYHEFIYPYIVKLPVVEGNGSIGNYFDININAFTPTSQVVQFSTGYGGLEAENRLQAYNFSFNKPVTPKVIKKIVKQKKIYSEEWQKRYNFDRVFFNNFPDNDSYWNFRAEELARTRATNYVYLPPKLSYKADKNIIKNYTSDYNTSPLYPLYHWTADSIDVILNNTDWQAQRVERIRKWARSYDIDENKINLINDDFWETGNFSSDASLKQLHQLMVTEINSLKNKAKEKYIDPASGEFGKLARDALREENKKREKAEISGGIAAIAAGLLVAVGYYVTEGIW